MQDNCLTHTTSLRGVFEIEAVPHTHPVYVAGGFHPGHLSSTPGLDGLANSSHSGWASFELRSKSDAVSGLADLPREVGQ
jgi:hypothetical protein